ncbi:MAG: hypothetical protein NTW28_22250 [Candidatus Solibacter sp.]|nr:hypothetical protein [Candidatus Solibacter sp.]
MTPEDIKKLLGGYATGTLTDEEQQALFAAALEDQELFDALAREQSLRDLLRDPAARAELLSALDAPANGIGGFWQWLRRPMVAGLATAGGVVIATVAVWQGTRVASMRPAAPVMVAELKRQEVAPGLPPAQPPPAASQPEVRQRARSAGVPAAVRAFESTVPAAAPPPAKERTQAAAPPAAAMADKKAVSAAAPPPPPAAIQAMSERRAEADATAPALAPPPPPGPAPKPAEMARKGETESTAAGQSAGAVSGAVKENVALDARALFYLDQLAPGANAFLESSNSVGAALPPARRSAARTEDAPSTAKTVSGLAAPTTATVPRLGVRVSILRGEREVDLTTVLDPGETVRLKLIANADGFLYIAEGARTVASGAVQRLKPFETSELRFEGSGQKQLVVTLSRRPRTEAPLTLGMLGRGNQVEASADQGRATYVVSGPRDAGAPQVVVPITLTYR